jgi:hypothetical protein
MAWLQKRRERKAAEKVRREAEAKAERERLAAAKLVRQQKWRRRKRWAKVIGAGVAAASLGLAWKISTTPVEWRKPVPVVKQEPLRAQKPLFGPMPRPNCLDYRIIGKPSLSAATVNRILVDYPENYSEQELQRVKVNGRMIKKWVTVFPLRGKISPLAGKGDFILQECTRYQIDPAVALAHFWIESRFGLEGLAVEHKNPANIRNRSNTGFRKLDSWEKGIHAWFWQIAEGSHAFNAGRFDAETIIPKFAPKEDGNNPDAYIRGMHRLAREWRQLELERNAPPKQ